MSTVHSYDLPKTAEYVAERVRRQATDKLYFGTFYDPLPRIPPVRIRVTERIPLGEAKSEGAPVGIKAEYLGHGKMDLSASRSAGAMADPKAESRRLLRLQVQDFLMWLQAQGAI